MEYPQEIRDQIRELSAEAQRDAQRLRSEADKATTVARVWCDLVRYLDTGWTMHFLNLAEKEAQLLKAMRADGHPAIQAIEEAYRIARDGIGRLFRRYPSALEEASREHGIALDSDSRHPKYSLKGGFFRLEIDENRRLARLSDYEGRLVDLPADIPATLQAIRREHDRVFGRKFSGAKFLRSMRSNYKAVLKKENLSDGSSLPIRSITRRMSKNIRGFRTDEFVVDLSRLAQEGPYEIDGRRLDLQQTKDTKQGMLLHGGAGRGYIGFVVFREVE